MSRRSTTRQDASVRSLAPPEPQPAERTPSSPATHPPAAEALLFGEIVLLENPLFGRCAQLPQPCFSSRFAVDPYHRFCPRETVADPGPVIEHQLQAVVPDHLADLMPKELNRIGLQL